MLRDRIADLVAMLMRRAALDAPDAAQSGATELVVAESQALLPSPR